VPYVRKMFRELGARVQLEFDCNQMRPFSGVMPPATWARRLKDHGFTVQPVQCVLQYLAVRRFARSRLAGFPWPRGLESMPTGSGKTLAAFWAAEISSGPRLYLVPRQDLLLQAADVFEKLYDCKPGVIGMGEWSPSPDFTMGMIQTLGPLARDRSARELHAYLETVKTVIVDEAHLVGDNSYLDVLDRCPNAWVRLAFGGSLLRRKKDLGDWHLIGAFGETLYHVPSKKLRDAGLLAEVRVFLLPVREPKLACRYPEAEKRAVHFNDAHRNRPGIAAAIRAADHGWITLMLVQKRKHGQHVQKLFAEMGRRVAFLCYKDPALLRKHYLEAMRHEDTRIVIASGIFNMGVDVPQIRCIVRLDAGESEINTMQISGRGMRHKDELNELFLIDFDDRTCKYFRNHTRARRRVYDAEQYHVEVVDDVSAIPFQKLRHTGREASRPRASSA